MNTTWETSNAEPSLDELFHDPIVRLLMQGDHTGESEVRRLIARVQAGLATASDDGASVPSKKRKAKRSRKKRVA